MRQTPRIVRRMKRFARQHLNGWQDGMHEGYRIGYPEGHLDGYAAGWEDRGLAEDAEPRELPLIVRMQRMGRKGEE
jgi:flagellar biosynthesis/type III secretory pathway protein FliH